MKLFGQIKFYIKNSIWNYKFWLFCKRKYVEYSFTKKSPINGKREKVIKKRFLGYEYKGKIYQDNPGMPITSEYEWNIVKKKM
tara:strand:+ start:321 stop:569 length:249 start_codon:yes stop_codon:yes gene_type:complete